ncbi:uncharacterized protein LOC114300191, partial [Camellia sinensis]|uniref:uncharacterized protein LOC114300191 n=1 Tax=Camellia sinensis TaxID=4442 RepID=UPI001036AB8F
MIARTIESVYNLSILEKPKTPFSVTKAYLSSSSPSIVGVDREDQERSTPLDLSFKVAPAKLVSGSIQSKMEDKEKTDILLLENLSEFREELANCSKFAELLSTGIDIFANDAFSQSHRIHASTVAITRFCYACVVGFHFEEGLYQ